MRTLFVLPACWYPKIKTLEDAKKAWREGKDFQIMGPNCYCSVRDADTLTADGCAELVWPGKGIITIL